MNVPEKEIGKYSGLASIPSNYSRLLGRMLGLKMHDLHLLLAKTGIDNQTFLEENLLLTKEQQICILQNTMKLSGRETIGLEIGRELTPHTHGTLGSLVIHSPDVSTAIKAVQEYIPTRFSFARLSAVSQLECVEYTINFDLDVCPHTYRVCSEIAAIVFFDVIKIVLGRTPSEVEVDFTFPKPDYYDRYAEYLPCPVTFSASEFKVRIPLSIIKEWNILADQQSYKAALKQCQALLAKINPNNSLYKTKVQKMLLSQAPGTLNVNEAAAALFMSRRTLARKLLTEGTTFHKTKEEILSQQAANYLSETNLSTEAIAAMLSYHDSSSFRRTFKRWYQMTPSEYRHQHQVN